MRPSIRCLTLIVALAIVLPTARAAEKPPPGAEEKPSVEVVELTVHPARPPRAALEYRLLPSYLHKSYGNAAPLYSKACLLLAQKKMSDKTLDDVVKWNKTPVDQLPCDQVRDALSGFDGVFRQVEVASRRTHCDWGIPIWESDSPYEILLPELQGSRNLARLVALEARLAIAEGHFDEAIHSLETGFALARHVADQSTVIGGLVGIAIASMMANQIEALVQLPDAPNLYWTLTALPTPLVDLRDAIEMESVAMYLMFPQFAAVQTKKYTPAQWNVLFDEEEIIAKFESLLQLEPEAMSARKKELGDKLEQAHPIAKRELVARGYSPDELDRMPVSQVVVLHTSLRFDELRDGMFKWFHVPYWQAREGVRAAQKEVEDSGKTDAIGLASLVLPAIANCQVAATRPERRIAALRCLEAIRFYAATHGGKLPASLDDVTEVPLPVNPFTGKPFEYRLEGKTAVLEATGGGVEHSRPCQYRVTLAE